MEELVACADEHAGDVFDTLETLCVCFPGRLSGSETLECALSYLMQHGERCLPCGMSRSEEVKNVPRWIRTDLQGTTESCCVSIGVSEGQWPVPHPLHRKLRLLANGLSVGTTAEGISGPLLIVVSLDELVEQGRLGNVSGKVVLFDYGTFTTYDRVGKLRFSGAAEAANFGALAVLVRALTPNSSCSGPHTGTQQSGVLIPSATVAIEDVEMLTRLHHKGYTLHVQSLILPCWQLPETTSRNLLFEIPGSEHPEEIVIIGGHTDCWDCANQSCQGAHDDGQGVVICLEIIRFLWKYNFRPKRTIRAVLFVDEEVGQTGAIAYQQAHVAEADNVIAAIETDMGVGRVCGFGFSGSNQRRQNLQELLEPLASLVGVPSLRVHESWSGQGVDIAPLIVKDGIPGLLLRHDDSWWNEEYFHFHHTASDTIDHVDKELLHQNFKTMLLTAWTLANNSVRLN
jgi:carboxypeptidase Q